MASFGARWNMDAEHLGDPIRAVASASKAWAGQISRHKPARLRADSYL